MKSHKKKKKMFLHYSCLVRIKEISIFLILTRNLTDRRNSTLDFEFSTFFFLLLSFFLYKILQSGETYESTSIPETRHSWREIFFPDGKKLFTIFTWMGKNFVHDHRSPVYEKRGVNSNEFNKERKKRFNRIPVAFISTRSEEVRRPVSHSVAQMFLNRVRVSRVPFFVFAFPAMILDSPVFHETKVSRNPLFTCSSTRFFHSRYPQYR